jgi:hypothetical protein
MPARASLIHCRPVLRGARGLQVVLMGKRSSHEDIYIAEVIMERICGIHVPLNLQVCI